MLLQLKQGYSVDFNSNNNNKTDEAFEYHGGEGIWQNWENKTTGEKSLKLHKPKVVKKWCAENNHYWEIVKNGVARCKKCGMERGFVLGLHKIQDGKFVPRNV